MALRISWYLVWSILKREAFVATTLVFQAAV